MRRATRYLGIVLICLASAGIAVAAPKKKAKALWLPKLKQLTTPLPLSDVKQEGVAQGVKTTAERLKESTTKACRECGGDGKIQTKGTGTGALVRPGSKECETCRGKGRVPAETAEIVKAEQALLNAVVHLAPNAQGTDTAMSEAYAALVDVVLKDQKVFGEVQSHAARALAQPKPAVGELLMLKVLYSGTMPSPGRSGEQVYVVRHPDREQAFVVTLPRLTEIAKPGSKTLIAGVVAGSVDCDDADGRRLPVLILERGFIITPKIDNGWW